MASLNDEPSPENPEMQGLLDTINRMVEAEMRVPPKENSFPNEVVAEVPPADDRIDRLGESMTQIGTELDTIKQMIKDLQTLTSAQTRLSTTMYHRQEETRSALSGLESQHNESKLMLKRLEQHLQAIYQINVSQQQQQQQQLLQAQKAVTPIHASPSPVDIQRSILATNALVSSAVGNTQVANSAPPTPYGPPNSISRAAEVTPANHRQYAWTATPPQSSAALTLVPPSMTESGMDQMRRMASQQPASEPISNQRQLALHRILQHPQAQNLTSHQLNILLAHSSPSQQSAPLLAQQQQQIQQMHQRVMQQTSQPQPTYQEPPPASPSQQLYTQHIIQQQQQQQQQQEQEQQLAQQHHLAIQQFKQQQQQLQSQESDAHSQLVQQQQSLPQGPDKRSQIAQQQQLLREQLRLQKQQKDREGVLLKDSPPQPLSKLTLNPENVLQALVADGNALTPPENIQLADVDSTQTPDNVTLAPIEHPVYIDNAPTPATSASNEPTQVASTPVKSGTAYAMPVAKKHSAASPSTSMLPVSLVKSTPPSQSKKIAAPAVVTPSAKSSSRNPLPAKSASAARHTNHPTVPSVVHAASKPRANASTTSKRPQSPPRIVKQDNSALDSSTSVVRSKPPGKTPAALSGTRKPILQKDQGSSHRVREGTLLEHSVGSKYRGDTEPSSPELGQLSPGSKAIASSANNSTQFYGHSRARTRTPPGSRSRSRSSFDSRHAESSGSSSEVTIKGSTKHRLSNEQFEHSRSKRRQLSPRASNNVLRFSDGEDDDGSSSDSIIAMNTKDKTERNSDSSPRRSRHGEVAIGIVGASGINIASRLGPRSSTYRPNLDDGPGSSYGYDSHVPSYLESRDGRIGYSSSGSLRRPTVIPLKDCSGQDITSERVSSLLGPFVFLDLSVMQKVYNMYFGCQPLVSGFALHTLHTTMTKLKDFRFKDIRNCNSSGAQTRCKFIARSGEGLRKAKNRIEYRLLENEVIPAPLLWCFIIQLGCFTIDEMSGYAVDYMFYEVTGKHLNRLRVVTADGVKHMSADEIWRLARQWATDLTNFVTEGRRVPESLGIAEEIFGEYLKKCREKGLSAPKQDKGEIAEKMLREHKHSQLFLGVRSGELKSLFKYLGYMMGNRIGRAAMNYLRETSSSFIRNN
ncbi:hypothetical protein H4R24_003036 [Coemansia sp. RSA 988]|nr:hypothetical protein H4R24_003036 [Coemansia sp. RSA 988]